MTLMTLVKTKARASVAAEYKLGQSGGHLFARRHSSVAAVFLIDRRLLGMHSVLLKTSIHQLRQLQTTQRLYQVHLSHL